MHSEDRTNIATALAQAFAEVSDRDLKEKLHENARDGVETSQNDMRSFTSGTRQSMYEQRDFVFLLRHLRRSCGTSGEAVALTPEKLVEGLERQFGGIPFDFAFSRYDFTSFGIDCQAAIVNDICIVLIAD